MAQRSFNDCEDEKRRILRERTRFYDELVTTVWFVEAKVSEDKNDLGTGFCFDSSGLILTCAHVIKEAKKICVVNVGNGLEYEAMVIRKYAIWDIAILKVQNVDRHLDYVTFANDGDRIYCGEEIHSIGNPDENLGSFFSGQVAYPCDGYHLENLTSSPRVDGRARGMWDGPMLSHRTIGCVSSFKPEYHHLSPNIPIIQISHYFGVEGASGSPVFDNRGYVVGMLFTLHDHHNLAIHFFALNHFLRNSDLSDDTKKSKSKKEKGAPPEKMPPKKKKK